MGPTVPIIERKACEAGLCEVLRFAGWVDGETVRKEIAASRALVLPSLGEGLPVVIMEAFALARPVISTQIAGTPELVVHGESGWLLTPGRADELANAMREALTSTPERLVEMGLAGRARVLEQHDVAREAEKLAALIRAAARWEG